MHCRSCRHARRVPTEVFRASLMIPSDSLERPVSLEPLPAAKELLAEPTVLRCSMRDAYVPGSGDCELHSLVFLGTMANGLRTLITGRNHDVITRRRLREEREQRQRKAAAREEANSFERLREPPRTICDRCNREHPRCRLCWQPRAECGLCPKCGFGARVARVVDDASREKWAWDCGRCSEADSATEPLPLPQWPADGLCEGCRDYVAKHPTSAAPIDQSKRGEP